MKVPRKLTEEELVRVAPFIDWRAPVRIESNGQKRLGCRICIAIKGVRGADVPGLPKDLVEFEEHMTNHHSKPPPPGESP